MHWAANSQSKSIASTALPSFAPLPFRSKRPPQSPVPSTLRSDKPLSVGSVGILQYVAYENSQRVFLARIAIDESIPRLAHSMNAPHHYPSIATSTT